MLPNGFVYLDEALPGVYWDAKYAGADNFTGAPVDGYVVNRVVGARELASALARVMLALAPLHLTLLLYDGYRPQRAVDAFARWASLPEDGRTKRVHYPRADKRDLFALGYIARKSGHSRGGTIDLTLADKSGAPLDMGGEFDLMDARSGHDFQELTPQQAQNRALLRRTMLDCGFTDYEREWWHYRLADEPYTDEYFDFPIA